MSTVEIARQKFLVRVLVAADGNPCGHCSFAASGDCPTHITGNLMCCDMPEGYISLESVGEATTD